MGWVTKVGRGCKGRSGNRTEEVKEYPLRMRGRGMSRKRIRQKDKRGENNE